jgi:Holliday junction resolvase-like predicted endonuclease
MTATAPACVECGKAPMLRRTVTQGQRRGKEVWRCQDRLCPGLINIEPDDEDVPAPVAGESAQAHFERGRASHASHLRIVFPVAAAIAVIFSVVAYFVVLPFGGITWASAAAIVAAVGTLYLVVKTPRDVVSWERGAEAERRVGAKLDALEAAGFVTLYDRRFPARGGNIDAIAIGPPGVFVVETKFRSKGIEVVNGRLEVGGWEQNDLINQAVDEALRVQISVAPEMNAHRLTVVPVLCFVGKKVGGGERSKGVIVTDDRSVANRIASQPGVLSADDVQRLARQLDLALPRNER